MRAKYLQSAKNFKFGDWVRFEDSFAFVSGFTVNGSQEIILLVKFPLYAKHGEEITYEEKSVHPSNVTKVT